MAEFYAHNLVEVELASGGIDSSQTTLPLASGAGSEIVSTLSGARQYPLSVYDSRYSAPHLDPNAEIVLVTTHDGSSDTVSVIARGQEGTSAVAHNTSGVTYKAQAIFTKAVYDEIIAKTQRPVETGTAFDSVKLYLPSTGDYGFYSVGAFSQTINRYYGTLWEAPKDGVIGECLIQKSNTGTSSANQRIAWFNPTSVGSLGIADLIEQSGVIASESDGAGSSKWVWTPSSIRVKRGRAYWVLCVSSATISSVYGATQGTSGSWQRLVGWQVQAFNNVLAVCGSQAGFTFGAFNDPFDATFDPDNGGRPIVWINYSS